MLEKVENQIFVYTPKDFGEAMKYAEIIANSNFCPKEYKGKSGDVLVAMQYGAELGLKPLAALQSIGVINGKPCVYGDGFWGVIISQPDCKDAKEWFEGEGNNRKAICFIHRDGRTPVTRSFSVEDAKKAQLWGKAGSWTGFTDRMLQMRARGFAARDAYADKLKGIITREEAEDYPQEKDMGEVKVVPQTERGVDSIKEKLGISPLPIETVQISFDDIKSKISLAESLKELELVADDAKHLNSEDKAEARKLYDEKQKQLKEVIGA
jgi:hypothetical protein